MILAAAVCLVALATSDVNAQATHEYDIRNCSIYPMKGHHAQNPNNCRSFFNCDNTNGGKLVSCPEGTLYDPKLGVCSHTADCPKWRAEGNCNLNPQNVIMIPGQCCDTYYTYSCANHSASFSFCPRGQYFNGAGCSKQPPPHACMKECYLMETPADPCLATHLRGVPGNNCAFRHEGSTVEVECSRGTKFSEKYCTCVRDDSYTCHDKLEPYSCRNKFVFNPLNNKFMSNLAPVPAYPSNVTLWKLEGSDLFYTPFALLIKFSIQPSGVQQYSIVTAEQDCTGLKLIVVGRGSTIEVLLGNNTHTLRMQGNLRSSNNIRLLIVIDETGFRGFIDTMQNSMSAPNAQGLLQDWARRSLDTLLCVHTVGPFNGQINEVSYWRSCTEIQTMLSS